MRTPPANVRLQRAYDDPTTEDGHGISVDGAWRRGSTRDTEHNQARVIGDELERRLATVGPAGHKPDPAE
jgi:hypothetical protein